MADQMQVADNAYGLVTHYRASFGALAKSDEWWEAFAGRVAELIATNSAFAGANDASKLLICRQIQRTNLWPGDGGDGEAYVVKYGGGAAYMVGPRGWVTLLYRAGAKSVTVECVHDSDTFDPGSLIPRKPPTLIPSAASDRSTRPFSHVVAYVEWADGSMDWTVQDMAYFERAMKKSPAGTKGPWGDWPEKMARAKALRLLAREVSRRVEMPEAIRTAINYAIEADVPPDEPAAQPKPSAIEVPREMPRAAGRRAEPDAEPAAQPVEEPKADPAPKTAKASAEPVMYGETPIASLADCAPIIVDAINIYREAGKDAAHEWGEKYQMSFSLATIKDNTGKGKVFARGRDAVQALVSFVEAVAAPAAGE